MTETIAWPADAAVIGTFAGDRIEPLIVEFKRTFHLPMISCLEVGCGRNPMHEWFAKIADGPHPVFQAVEPDPVIGGELRARGIRVSPGLPDGQGARFDLVIAKEVIEHLRADQTLDFLRSCAAVTGAMFAFTVPNFEYWPGLRVRAELKEMRFVPDHFKDYDPGSDNPHRHKQQTTPLQLLSDMGRVFADRFEYRVFRAWPWTLSDDARGTSWQVYFKVFGIAVRLGPSSGHV